MVLEVTLHWYALSQGVWTMFCPSMVVFAPSFMDWIRANRLWRHERGSVVFLFHKELHSFIFLNCFLSSTKSILVSQTYPVWFPQIGFLQTSLTPLWPIRVEFKPCHSPQKKRENLTTLVLCLMKMCFHVLRHFFSFSLLVKEVPWFKKRERKEIYQAR